MQPLYVKNYPIGSNGCPIDYSKDINLGEKFNNLVDYIENLNDNICILVARQEFN